MRHVWNSKITPIDKGWKRPVNIILLVIIKGKVVNIISENNLKKNINFGD